MKITLMTIYATYIHTILLHTYKSLPPHPTSNKHSIYCIKSADVYFIVLLYRDSLHVACDFRVYSLSDSQ